MSKILVAAIGQGPKDGQEARGDGLAFTVEFCLPCNGRITHTLSLKRYDTGR
jgi:hypothetical protein